MGPKKTHIPVYKGREPPGGGRLFEVLSHRLCEVFFPGAITYFQLSQRMIFFAHIDTPIFNSIGTYNLTRSGYVFR